MLLLGGKMGPWTKWADTRRGLRAGKEKREPPSDGILILDVSIAFRLKYYELPIDYMRGGTI